MRLQKKKKHEVHVDVCAVSVTVLVVFLVVVVMISAVVVLSVFFGCFVSTVMCPLLCVHCECLALDAPPDLGHTCYGNPCAALGSPQKQM